ncbi:MAG: TonB-dependent receptor [Rhodothermaceae bacterium]|nr:TonB-dependent receptor [Rhodothermaceae bacterium]
MANLSWLSRMLIAAFMVLGVHASAFAQVGSISGVIIDQENGETLIGANVLIEGTMTGSTTDIDGRFQIPGLDPGSYTLVISYIGYNTITVQNVEVTENEVTSLEMTMSPEAIGLDEVVIEARAVQNTEASLLRDRQKSISVSDAISAEAISRSGSGDAASAMTKVTGASVVGGKYVFIRGLGDRYSSTQLNGAELPSADPNRKSFQLDLFPSSLLDNIVTTKTFTPDKPGNFAGGLVNVGTKDFPESFTFQVSTSSSYNTRSSLADNFLTYSRSESDWLGFDDGHRDIPDLLADPDIEIPIEIEARFDPEKAAQLDLLSRSFRPEMQPRVDTAPINSGLSIAIGNQISLGNRPFGYTASFTYNTSAGFYDDGSAGRWELVGGNVEQINALTALRNLGDIRASQERNWGGLLTLAYKLHANHEVVATYLRTQSGESTSRFLDGFWVDLSGNSTFQTRVLSYQERSLNSLQFKGEHYIGGITAEWKASVARNEQDEPDLRYFSNHFTINGVTQDTVYQKPASLYPAPTRFYRFLQEDNQNFSLDLSVPFKFSGLSSKVKFGGAYLKVDRDFRERRFEYREGTGFSYTSFDGDNDAFFAQAGIVDTTSTGLFRFGNTIVDASSDRSNYVGDRTVSAAYAMVDLLVSQKVRLIGGARFEATRMNTVSEDEDLTPGRLDNDDILPSINVVYSLQDNMNLRAAYTQTLARPTFRELAPYSTFDFVGDFVFSGNATLKRTLVTNYDLRWEWFLRPGEILAFSGFYKNFENPIERVILTSVGNNTLGIQNVDEARVFGIEVEARKRLDSVSPFLSNFQIGANLSIVESQVDIPEEELAIIRAADPDPSTTRNLAGQSPFLVNIDLAYENYEKGTAASLFYNVFGDRLQVVSEGAAPDIFERARGTLDFIVSQRIWRGISAKFSAKNLTDSPTKWSQDFKSTEYLYQRYENGRTFSLSFTYKVE